MSRHSARILNYIKMSLLFVILGAAVLSIGGRPLASYIISLGNMIVVKGAPEDLSTSGLKTSGPIVNINGNSDQSEIRTPEPDSQYATVTCERIALTAPIYYGDSEACLAKGVGQYSKSSLPGEGKPILLSGHDSTFFAPLEGIKAGDIIRITADYGEFNYIVVSEGIADKSDTTAYDLTQDKEQLILYTCYPFGKVTGSRNDRFFVYCDRILDTEKAEK
jgi:sortase A